MTKEGDKKKKSSALDEGTESRTLADFSLRREGVRRKRSENKSREDGKRPVSFMTLKREPNKVERRKEKNCVCEGLKTQGKGPLRGCFDHDGPGEGP